MSGVFIPGLGPGYRLTMEDAPVDTDVEVLPHALEAYNESQWPQHPPWRPLAIFVRDEAQIVAGLAGETYCGWLFVRYLWVSDVIENALPQGGKERGWVDGEIDVPDDRGVTHIDDLQDPIAGHRPSRAE